ncbi:DUF6296 family protein [Kitasatospora sp. NPDC059571]|uniref:DUF6296 family protein n=1 Tax=Kitasatospora sp. NPDC059571 TaxID=3346871 RepID=UPI0036A62CD4
MSSRYGPHTGVTPPLPRITTTTGCPPSTTASSPPRPTSARAPDERRPMDGSHRYAVTLPGPPGGHRPPEVVVVRPTGELTATGVPVYADDAGAFRVAIEGEAARPLTVSPRSGRHTCLHAVPLP